MSGHFATFNPPPPDTTGDQQLEPPVPSLLVEQDPDPRFQRATPRRTASCLAHGRIKCLKRLAPSFSPGGTQSSPRRQIQTVIFLALQPRQRQHERLRLSLASGATHTIQLGLLSASGEGPIVSASFAQPSFSSQDVDARGFIPAPGCKPRRVTDCRGRFRYAGYAEVACPVGPSGNDGLHGDGHGCAWCCLWLAGQAQ